MKQANARSFLSLTFMVLFASSVQDAGAQVDKCLYEVRAAMSKAGIKKLDKPEMTKIREYCERGEVDKAVALLLGKADKVDSAPAEIVSFSVSTGNIKKGNSVTLSWSTANANTVMLGTKGSTDFQSVEATGSKTISPDKTSTYVLMVSQSSKNESAAMTSKAVQVNVSYDPVIGRFSSSPSTLRKGQNSELTWQVYAADEVTLDGVSVPHAGEKNVSPDRSTIYTLKAWTDGQILEEYVKVNVSPYQRPSLSFPFYELELCKGIDKSGDIYRCISPDGPFWNGDTVSVITRFKNLPAGQHKVKRIIYSSGVYGDRNWTEIHQEESGFQNSNVDGQISFEIPSRVSGALKLELMLDNKKSNTSVTQYCVECPGHDEW